MVAAVVVAAVVRPGRGGGGSGVDYVAQMTNVSNLGSFTISLSRSRHIISELGIA